MGIIENPERDGHLIYSKNMRRHEYGYRARVRKQRIKILLTVLAIALVLAAGVFAVVRIVKKIESMKQEPEKEVIALEGFNDPDKPAAEEIVGEFVDTEIPEETEKLPFFEGYKVYKDSDTKAIYSEEIISNYAILIDLKTGHVVAERNGFSKMYPASMTKVLTLLVAVEHLDDMSATFTMTQDIADFVYKNDCSQVGYSVGETMTMRELLFGLIMPSGGDAALALARCVAGDTESFVEMMNNKVSELGLSDVAHFTNPIGIFDEENYCTPAAMAMIMKAALENPTCREVLGQHIYKTEPTEEHPDGITLSNLFLRRIEDKETGGEVLGAKTGYVNESGNCAVSYSIQNSDNRYICVTGASKGAWRCIYDHCDIYTGFAE
jgi:D-alanyl-D-alanine carboxypeptidase (penicillin-binding protein 5/6)